MLTSNRLTRRSMVTGLAGGLVTTLAAPHVARAAARLARFGHNGTPNSPFGRGAAALAAAIESDPALAAVLRIEVFGNAQLGDDMSMLKSCHNGTLDGALVGASAIGNFANEIGLLNAPYLFRDVIHARMVLDGEIGRQFSELAAAKGLPVLAWGENGLRHITANVAIRIPTDLHGLRIRVPQSEVMLGGFRALGAVPAPLPIPLLREALRGGEFQAQENPITIIESVKLYELQKYCSLTGHIIDPLGFILSSDLLEDLTGPQRIALEAAARTAAGVTRTVSDAAALDGVARLRAQGMVVIDDVDLNAFQTAARPYLHSLGPVYGANRIQQILSVAS